MILGNQQAQHVLQSYIHRIQQEGVIPFPFLLLHGPAHVGKTTLVEQLLHELLGVHYATDYLPIYDLTEKLEKTHTLKVEVDPKDQMIELDGHRYQDRGTRDIVQWLAYAPVGRFKIVFLENIERMNSSAANAFLKTLEEPLPNRLIIATTAHKELLLDTIMSRAFLVGFQLPSYHELIHTIKERYPSMDPALQEFIASFSLGRLGAVRSLAANSEELQDQAQAFHRLLQLVRAGGSIVEQYKLLQQFSQWGEVQQVIDAVLYAFTPDQLVRADHWLQARALLRTNVGEDNILFHLAVAGSASSFK